MRRPAPATVRSAITVLAVTSLAASSGTAGAATLRLQVDQRGDFTLIGNTLGYDCAPGTPAPIVGTVGDCGPFVDDNAPDVFWRADEPATGEALADVSVPMAESRSSAVLTLPAGAVVTHAWLYWGAVFAATADVDVTFERPGTFSQTVTATDSYLDPTYPTYQSVADVTALVQQHGAGLFRVSGVSSFDYVGLNDIVQFSGWSLVVFYELDSDPPRNLALFDGLDRVVDAAGQSIPLSGFLVPNAAFDGKLGVVAYEGDNQGSGDQLLWDGNALGDALNPSTNFFNSTRSFLAAPAYNVGDLPELTGTAQSTAGLDLDVVDITPYLSAGQTSAVVHATTSGENFWLGALITSVSTLEPDFRSTTKSGVDVDGVALLAGDEVEYTISVANTGSDTSEDTILTDPLPSQVTLVPGSIEITEGPNAGLKTEATLDDEADYDAPTKTLVVRLGAAAGTTQGGSLTVGETTTIVFRVLLDAGATGSIENQGTITASGAQGAPLESTPTDGNGPSPGSPPTILFVDDCGADDDCDAPEPYCDTASNPNVCVECRLDRHCPPLEPTCDASGTCVCVPAGAEMCGNAADEDCDGIVDNGCGGAGGGSGGDGGAAGGDGSGGMPAGGASPSSAASGAAGGDVGELGSLEGGGCGCVVAAASRKQGIVFWLGVGMLGLLMRARRRRAPDPWS